MPEQEGFGNCPACVFYGKKIKKLIKHNNHRAWYWESKLSEHIARWHHAQVFING